MKVNITNISYLIGNFLGVNRLTKQFLSFSKAHLCFIVASNIHSVFVNILLLRQADDVNITIYYNMTSYFCSGVGMLLAGAVAKKVTIKTITFIGIGLYVAAYGMFVIFMETIVLYVVPVAIFLGAGGGFFYFTYSINLSAYSTDESRDVSMAFIGIVSSAIALLVPAVSGAVIGVFEGFTGYTIMFIAAFIIAGISLYLFSGLEKIEPDHQKPQYIQCLKQIHTNPCWFLVTAQVFLRSIRDGVFLFFLNVLLFQYVPSEAIIGLNSLWVGFVAIFAQFLCGKYSKPSNRIQFMLVATTVLTSAAALLYLELGAATVLLLSTVNAFFVVFLMNPASSIDFLVIQTMPDGFSCRGEYLALFEFYRNVGRLVGLTFLLCMPQTPIGYVSALVVISGVQYLSVLCARGTVLGVQNYQKKTESDGGSKPQKG